MPTRNQAKRPYHHGDLKTALVRAALQLIAEHGVQGLALSDAAALAGVSVAAPYRHFKDKQALLGEIAGEGFTIFRDALAQASQTHADDRVECLVEMGMAYVAFSLQHRSHFKVMWASELCKTDYPEVEKTAAQAYALLHQAAVALLPDATPGRQQALVCAAWSIVHGYASLALEGVWPRVAAQHDQESVLRQSLHLLVDQFAVGPDESRDL